MTELRVRLAGEGADLGSVPARDVARLIVAVEDALRRAAAVVRGEPKITSGRYPDVIEQAAQLRLRAIEPGSVIPVLELPAPGGDGGFDDFLDATLGEVALARLLDAADPSGEPDPHVAEALLWVADEVRLGDKYESVTFEERGRGQRPPRFVRLDGESRGRLRSYVRSRPAPPERSDAITGTLVEADFERGSARLRTTSASAVSVAFSEAQADAIHRALREPATLRGVVTYDPATNVATRVDLQTVITGEQLVLGIDTREYWRAPSFDELAREQGAGHALSPADLHDYDATDAERDALVAAILEAQ